MVLKLYIKMFLVQISSQLCIVMLTVFLRKKHELVAFINNAPCKPKLIALTEIKHKNKWDTELSELLIPGYSIYSNNLNINTRGIIVYVSQDILCKQLNYDSNFSEFILLEIACKDNTKLTVGVF